MLNLRIAMRLATGVGRINENFKKSKNFFIFDFEKKTTKKMILSHCCNKKNRKIKKGSSKVDIKKVI